MALIKVTLKLFGSLREASSIQCANKASGSESAVKSPFLNRSGCSMAGVSVIPWSTEWPACFSVLPSGMPYIGECDPRAYGEACFAPAHWWRCNASGSM